MQAWDVPKGLEHPEAGRVEDVWAEDAVRNAEFFEQTPENLKGADGEHPKQPLIRQFCHPIGRLCKKFATAVGKWQSLRRLHRV